MRLTAGCFDCAQHDESSVILSASEISRGNESGVKNGAAYKKQATIAASYAFSFFTAFRMTAKAGYCGITPTVYYLLTANH